MTPFSEHIRVAVKVLATDTARLIAADSADLPRTRTISDLLGNSLSRPPETAAGSDPGRSGAVVRPVPGRIQSTPSYGPPPSSPVTMEQEFQYELLECRGMATSVKCSFRITNTGRDRTLFLYCGRFGTGTKAFDNFGNESPGDTLAIANTDSSSGYFAGASVSMQLISGVPVPASVHLPNVGASASSLSLITISGMVSDGGRPFTVSFRNVPILR